ncbi:MAG: hypothetical protein ING71_17445 [Rhodocyclaceae bacterium]|nr:hypothetical protein [Rhodocyclaceae bacterium]
MPNKWTPEQIELMTAHYKEGISASVSAGIISKRFEISLTRNAVIGIRHRLGLVRNISYTHFKTNVHRAIDLASINAATEAKRRLERAERLAKQKSNKERQEEIRSLKLAVREAMRVDRESKIEPLSVHTRDAVLGLKRNSCKFPIGVVGAPDFHFCGKPQSKDSSYCADHKSVCTVYVPMKMKVTA